MNLKLIQEKLDSLKGGSQGSNSIWRPKKNTQVIRFLPYAYDPEWPITELQFHYDITNGSVLSPNSFGKPDPINEFADKLKSTGDREDFLASRKIHSTTRWFAPILVRGEETEGVKFWGFSRTIYEALLKFANEEDFGDFTDLKSGRDFSVDYTPAVGADAYPTITLRPKMATSKVTDSKEVLEMIKEMPDVKTLFKTMTYEELDRKLQIFLEGPKESSTDTVLEEDDTDQTTTTSTASQVTKTATSAPKSTNLTDLDDEFANMFK